MWNTRLGQGVILLITNRNCQYGAIGHTLVNGHTWRFCSRYFSKVHSCKEDFKNFICGYDGKGLDVFCRLELERTMRESLHSKEKREKRKVVRQWITWPLYNNRKQCDYLRSKYQLKYTTMSEKNMLNAYLCMIILFCVYLYHRPWRLWRSFCLRRVVQGLLVATYEASKGKLAQICVRACIIIAGDCKSHMTTISLVAAYREAM